jgi:hypothetical protein
VSDWGAASGQWRLGQVLADFLSRNFAWLGKFEDGRARDAEQWPRSLLGVCQQLRAILIVAGAGDNLDSHF